MSKPSPVFLDKVERWLLGGVNIEKVVMSPDQRFRAMLAYEVYKIWLSDKQIRPSDMFRKIAAREYPIILERAAAGETKYIEYVRAMNIRPGIPRTPTEIANDVALLNHIIGRFDTSIENIEKAKVQDASDWLIREGMKMGDTGAVKKGADLKMQLNNNFQEKENPTEQMPNADINITGDVSVIKRDRVNYSDEFKRKMARKHGLSEKQVIDLVQNADGSWQMPDENQDVEPTPDIFDPLDSEK